MSGRERETFTQGQEEGAGDRKESGTHIHTQQRMNKHEPHHSRFSGIQEEDTHTARYGKKKMHQQDRKGKRKLPVTLLLTLTMLSLSSSCSFLSWSWSEI